AARLPVFDGGRRSGRGPPVLLWSPNARRLLVRQKSPGNAPANVLDAADGTVNSLSLPSEFISWAPDGELLALNAQDGLSVWDVAEKRRVRRISGINTWQCPVAWSPDGKKIATAVFPSRDVWIFDVGTGKELVKSLKMRPGPDS